mgnify:CR=1 FL=1
MAKGLPRSLEDLYARVEALEAASGGTVLASDVETKEAINSVGGNITIAAGTTVEAALQTIADVADPEV